MEERQADLLLVSELLAVDGLRRAKEPKCQLLAAA